MITRTKVEIVCQYLILQVLASICLFISAPIQAQQILWAKTYPLPLIDDIYSIAKDTNGFLYVGGNTDRNHYISYSGMTYPKAIITKLFPNGDTVFVKDLGIAGTVVSMVVDPFGLVRANVRQDHTNAQFQYHTYYVWMMENGSIFKMDSIQNAFSANSCILAKDSSIIIAGLMFSPVTPGYRSMFWQRITKDWIIEPVVELNPGHPNCRADRVEQLPNGHYLVSGTVGSRIASYELNEDGTNPVFKQWYQTPDFSNLIAGYVGQATSKRSVISGQGSPCRIGLFDSLQQKIWMKSDTGILIAPQAMTDGSLMFGYSYRPQSPTKYFQRMAADSSTIWKMSFGDSLIDRGYPGSVKMNAFTSFPDGSAVLAGIYRWDGAGTTNTKEDPFFLRIANVGTPVTSLTKPKRGTLSNETLAPWPNPSGGTLYLKQHFDKAEVHFYTVSGREVQTDTVRFGQPIDISSFAPGLYLYRAVIDGKPFSGKVFKN